MKFLPVPAFTLFVSLAAAASLHAGVYLGTAYEPFNYSTTAGGDAAADGNLAANGGGTGFNPTGNSSLPNTTVWGTGTGVTAAANASITAGSLTGPVSLEGNRATFAAGAAGRALGQSVDAVILRIDFDANALNDRVRVYLDPLSLSNENDLVPYLDNSNFDLGAITNFRPFTGAAATDLPAASADFDEIRIGSTFASVAVPEPDLAALSGIGILLTALRRRR